MKKLLTLKTYVLWIAAVLAIIAFVLSFAAEVINTIEILGVKTSSVYKNVIWGSNEQIVTASSSLGSATETINEEFDALTLPLIGYILIAVGGFISLALPCLSLSVFKKQKMASKIVCFFASLLMIAGGIISFTTLSQFFKVYEIAKEGQEYFSVNAIVIISGIVAILAGVICLGSECVAAKKARKKSK